MVKSLFLWYGIILNLLIIVLRKPEVWLKRYNIVSLNVVAVFILQSAEIFAWLSWIMWVVNLEKYKIHYFNCKINCTFLLCAEYKQFQHGKIFLKGYNHLISVRIICWLPDKICNYIISICGEREMGCNHIISICSEREMGCNHVISIWGEREMGCNHIICICSECEMGCNHVIVVRQLPDCRFFIFLNNIYKTKSVLKMDCFV